MPFAGLGLVGIVMAGAPRRRRKAAMILIALFVLSTLTLLSGCGTNKIHYGTPPGTYPVTVTATSGNVSHSANFNLTVQ